MKYVYPAVFHAEPEGGYTIFRYRGLSFSGETIQECCEMAEDALTLMLWDMEENHISAPSPTPINEVHKENKDDIVTLVKADTLAYRRKYDTKAIKKTLSIPQWLDTMAQEKASISQMSSSRH